jgi:propionyl-CoA carboxylase alpha chain
MFKKILIANRGEIACRIIRTARHMGIATVAVYSEADARALHVEMADEKVPVGPPPATQSYLAIDRIVAACLKTGAEAVHPGYGFLAEHPAFPQALAAAGIAFIGPNAAAIAAMGDKIEAKRRAAAAGVATVPGRLGTVADAEEAVRIARAIGYPVMIKAAAGGGGKGMRIANGASEVREGFARARSEANSSFGDDRVFLEKFIVDPRHVEIQVLGDRHGNMIHLGERECSIQRRNQKVVEEAPSPLLDEQTRRAMGAQAVALASAVGYDSAGTVEFVVGQDRSFHFLEMNTRLQVEHPVTELVTGIDLVEQMIRVAAGERLALRQEDVRLVGWAIEARVYAEDPSRGFLPSSGRLAAYRPPTEETGGATVRNDGGVQEGGEIPIWYDPLIAKLCTHAASRGEAIAAMARALDGFAIDGIRHNLPFLAALMHHPRWIAGALSTGFIAEEYPDGFSGAPLTPGIAATLARVAVVLDRIESRHKPRPAAQRMVRLGSEWFEETVTEETDALADRSGWIPGAPTFRGEIGGAEAVVQVRRILNGYRLSHRGVTVEAHVFPRREAELARKMPEKARAGSAKKLLCPMPGVVVAIAVGEGQEVKAGETLAVVEAMKMENVLRAERDATVARIAASTGDSLAVDAVIMEFA